MRSLTEVLDELSRLSAKQIVVLIHAAGIRDDGLLPRCTNCPIAQYLMQETGKDCWVSLGNVNQTIHMPASLIQARRIFDGGCYENIG